MEDLIAAGILSCFLPGITGTVHGSHDERNTAVRRAAERLLDMTEHGCVKNGWTGEPIPPPSASEEVNYSSSGTSSGPAKVSTNREMFWDGGLVNAFPYVDEETVVVSPFAADFPFRSINPSLQYTPYDKEPRGFYLTPWGRVHMTPTNVNLIARSVAFISDQVLEDKFSEGYDNAHHFLDRHNLLSVFRSAERAS
jgi:hypothetical protein